MSERKINQALDLQHTTARQEKHRLKVSRSKERGVMIRHYNIGISSPFLCSFSSLHAAS